MMNTYRGKWKTNKFILHVLPLLVGFEAPTFWEKGHITMSNLFSFIYKYNNVHIYLN
jgi:hypothetical protein